MSSKSNVSHKICALKYNSWSVRQNNIKINSRNYLMTVSIFTFYCCWQLRMRVLGFPKLYQLTRSRRGRLVRNRKYSTTMRPQKLKARASYEHLYLFSKHVKLLQAVSCSKFRPRSQPQSCSRVVMWRKGIFDVEKFVETATVSCSPCVVCVMGQFLYHVCCWNKDL